MSKKIEKYETTITITFIILYLLLNSLCINNFGEISIITALCNICLSIIILLFIIKNKLVAKHKGQTHKTLRRNYREKVS